MVVNWCVKVIISCTEWHDHIVSQQGNCALGIGRVIEMVTLFSQQNKLIEK